MVKTYQRKVKLSKRQVQKVSFSPDRVVSYIRTSIGKSVRRDYLLDKIMSKYADPSPETARIRERRAYAKFLWQSRRNAVTEARLRTCNNQEIVPGYTRASLFHGMARHIDRILGGFEFEKCVSKEASFSGGASTAFKRTSGLVSTKLEASSHVTRDLEPYLPYFFQGDLFNYWRIRRNESIPLEIVRGNIMFTVPKENDIDRAACKEPDLNMFLQKGLGSYIRKKLKINGVDLNDQTINQRLARQGSLDGSLCTVDLSAASDSITQALIEKLFSWEWDYALRVLRSNETYINGKWRRTNVITTMGNGYTFELESLIFYSALCALRDIIGNPDDIINVYGDDIVCPTHYYEPLAALFREMGFQVNDDKSFYEGPFRESCGKHYHNGVDVTPFYIREPINTLPRVIWLLNKIKEWDSCDGVLGGEFESLYLEVLKTHPLLRACMGPGDISSNLIVHSPLKRGRLHQNTRLVKQPQLGAYLNFLSRIHGTESGVYSVVYVPNGTYSIRSWVGENSRCVLPEYDSVVQWLEA